MPHEQNLVFLGMEGDLTFQWTNLLFLFPPVAKAMYDVFYTEAKHFPVIHKQSMAYAMTMGGILAFIDWQAGDVKYFLQSAFLGISIFWLIFDYLRNVLAGKKWYYMDIVDTDPGVEDSWVDSHIYSRIPDPRAWLFIKIWVSFFAFSIYYFFSYIG